MVYVGTKESGKIDYLVVRTPREWCDEQKVIWTDGSDNREALFPLNGCREGGKSRGEVLMDLIRSLNETPNAIWSGGTWITHPCRQPGILRVPKTFNNNPDVNQSPTTDCLTAW